MPSDESRNLEVKVDLLLALAVDERLWPEGEYRDVREILARAGLDLAIGDQAHELLQTLAHLDRPYFLSRGWVGRRLEDVLERLDRLEKSLEELAASTRQHVETISANTNRLTGLEQNLGSLKADTTSLLQDNRGFRESLNKIADQYATLKTGSADIAAALSELRAELQRTAKDVQELNTAVGKLQR